MWHALREEQKAERKGRKAEGRKDDVYEIRNTEYEIGNMEYGIICASSGRYGMVRLRVRVRDGDMMYVCMYVCMYVTTDMRAWCVRAWMGSACDARCDGDSGGV